jgi:hypothetical protein
LAATALGQSCDSGGTGSGYSAEDAGLNAGGLSTSSVKDDSTASIISQVVLCYNDGSSCSFTAVSNGTYTISSTDFVNLNTTSCYAQPNNCSGDCVHQIDVASDVVFSADCNSFSVTVYGTNYTRSNGTPEPPTCLIVRSDFYSPNYWYEADPNSDGGVPGWGWLLIVLVVLGIAVAVLLLAGFVWKQRQTGSYQQV